MKQLKLCAVAAALASIGNVSAWALDLGSAAPAFELPASERTVSLAAYAGKVVYLDFWASWCAPCRQSFPWMNELTQRYGQKGLVVLGVNLDQRVEAAQEFLKSNPARFTVAFDRAGQTPRLYGVKSMPSSFLIGPDGKVLAQHSGFRDAQRAEVEKEIEDALRRVTPGEGGLR